MLPPEFYRIGLILGAALTLWCVLIIVAAAKNWNWFFQIGSIRRLDRGLGRETARQWCYAIGGIFGILGAGFSIWMLVKSY